MGKFGVRNGMKHDVIQKILDECDRCRVSDGMLMVGKRCGEVWRKLVFTTWYNMVALSTCAHLVHLGTTYMQVVAGGTSIKK